jgi:hypothetical protein
MIQSDKLPDGSPERSEMLTIEDLDELPHGTATVVTVFNDRTNRLIACRIDDSGYLRTFDGKYIPRYMEIDGYRR